MTLAAALVTRGPCGAAELYDSYNFAAYNFNAIAFYNFAITEAKPAVCHCGV